MPDFKLPDLGEGVTEAEIDRWLVKEGQEIEEDDLLVEVITDKATAEIPSPYAGKVTKLHVSEGQVVPVGTVLISIGGGSQDDTPAPEARADEPALNSRVVESAETVATSHEDDGRVKATPPVRKLARELGIDLEQIPGSGPNGRILREDVEAAASGGTGPAAPTTKAPSGGRREPLRGIRRTIAERMAEAHRAIPPVTHVEECDVTELDATRKLANEREAEGVRLTYLPFIVKAVVAGLRKYPSLNASLDEPAGEIVYYDHYDIGVAVDTPSGLTVPVVHGADKLRLRELAAEIERLATSGREGTLKGEELRGSTFTVTSPGKFGGLMATPIIFYPQSAILGVHKATDRPVVRDGDIVIRKIMNLSITFDHRILDGLTAAKFALDVASSLEHPATLLIE